MKLFRSQSKSQSNILPFYLKSDWLTDANISQYLLKAISIKIKWMTGNDWDFNFIKANSKQFKTNFAPDWLNKGLKIAWIRTLPVEKVKLYQTLARNGIEPIKCVYLSKSRQKFERSHVLEVPVVIYTEVFDDFFLYQSSICYLCVEWPTRRHTYWHLWQYN